MAHSKQEIFHNIQQCCNAQQQYDIILIDWHISDIDAIQIIKEIRNVLSDTIPILFLIDYDKNDTEEIEKILTMKNTGIITKPFFVSALKEKIIEMQLKQNEMEVSEITKISTLEGLHFLAAEDNEINAEILEELLEIEGASCEIVENGQLVVERFSRAKENEFDAILMDVQMPVMNGYEATIKIRALDREDAQNILIIAMTANAFAEDEKEALDAGMNVHMAKPIDIELLKKIIKQYVKRKE